MVNYSGFCLLPPQFPKQTSPLLEVIYLAPASTVKSGSFETCPHSGPPNLEGDEECLRTLGLSALALPIHRTPQPLPGLCRLSGTEYYLSSPWACAGPTLPPTPCVTSGRTCTLPRHIRVQSSALTARTTQLSRHRWEGELERKPTSGPPPTGGAALSLLALQSDGTLRQSPGQPHNGSGGAGGVGVALCGRCSTSARF